MRLGYCIFALLAAVSTASAQSEDFFEGDHRLGEAFEFCSESFYEEALGLENSFGIGSYEEVAPNGWGGSELEVVVAEGEVPKNFATLAPQRPKVCDQYGVGPDGEPLLSIIQLLEALLADINSFGKPPLSAFNQQDLINRLEDCRKSAGKCSAALMQSLEHFSADNVFGLLDNAADGSKPDKVAGKADITALISQFRIIIALCSGRGTKGSGVHCALCTYSSGEEKICAEDSTCSKPLCRRDTGGACHSSMYYKCKEYAGNQPNGTIVGIWPQDEFNSIEFSLNKAPYNQCDRFSYVHYGHSHWLWLRHSFPNLMRVCVEANPMCSNISATNLGCSTFSSESGNPTINQAGQLIAWLIATHGYENIEISCTGNQDLVWLSPLPPEVSYCSEATVKIKCNEGKMTKSCAFLPCEAMKGRPCKGKGSRMLCGDGTQSLTCTEFSRGLIFTTKYLIWQ